MLTSLFVRNIVLIDKLDLEFEPGLTVLTGETGAGKSILLDSLSLALGMRAETRLIRHGEKEASVTASFNLSLSHPIGVILSQNGYGFDGEIILRRVLTSEGKSRSYINGEPIPLNFLKKIGENLVEIHGQFASHRLLDPSTHQETLDNYGVKKEYLDRCRHAFNEWQYRKRERDTAEQNLIQAQKEEEFLRTSIADLEKLDPKVDEEEVLVKRRTSLMNSEKIINALNSAFVTLSDEGSGCLKLLRSSETQVEHANILAENELKLISDQIGQAITLIEDSLNEIEGKMQDLGDVSELPEIDDRLFSLRDMARKHQVDIQDLPNLLEQLKKQIDQLEKGEDEILKLQDLERKARQAYEEAADELSKARHQAAERLDDVTMKELPALKLDKATFKTMIEKLPEEDWGKLGWDKVSFLVSTNKGTPLAPINKIASGGELSRFMLALKVNLNTTSETETLVFDEIDTGISGATASSVGERLKRLSDRNQVLVITHSPQVAGYGKNHYIVQKVENDLSTTTSVQKLDDDGRLEEIARLVSGETITDKSREVARELLKC